MRQILIYGTAKDEAEAQLIAETLVKEKLAACVNCLSPVQSVYIWLGEIQTAKEVAFFAKTTSQLWERCRSRIKDLSSYETPCVMAFKPEEIDQAFGAWISRETEKAKESES